MKEREKLGSRLGFILISAGCAIGIGNVWKFPYMAGQGGGGTFVLFYLIFLALFCWTCQPEESCQSILRTGKTRTEMAHPWIYHSDRMLSPDDVLHHCYRLDAELLLYDSHR